VRHPCEEGHLVLRLVGIALRRPTIIPHLLGAAWAMRARGWFKRPPFLPLPPRGYVDWRMETAYGSADAHPPVEELVRYLAWSARLRRLMRRGPRD
jgi:hypothetical protein